MESLTKTQLVLLTLLISFVTSIATGIMTSSLLQSAPANVTQTINRVVERTIEKADLTTGTKEVQVVSVDDKVVSAISKNQNTLVRIRQISQDGSNNFYSLGVVISKDGQILAEKTNEFNSQGQYSGVFSDGTVTNLYLIKDISEYGVLLFKTGSLPIGGISVASLSKSMPQLGQTVVLLEGQSENHVLVGRITNIQGESSTTPKFIETDLTGSKGTSGAPILDLSGDILGIRREDVASLGNVFIYSQRFQKAIAK